MTVMPLQVLRTIRGFSELDDAEFARLADRATVTTWSDGEAILRRGAPGDALYVLVDGAAEVPLDDSAGSTAKLAAGALFGEIAMLSGGVRTADVISVGPSTTLALRRQDVEPLMWEHPKLARLLTSLLRHRLRRSGVMNQVGKYQLLGPIGQGASSDVFEARHEGLDRLVAVKMLSHTLAFDRPLRDRFLAEARILGGLDHPNIVRVYDTESAFATYFIVMERLRGASLRAVMADRSRSTDPIALVAQAAAALGFAHEHGVVHGDVKPSNCGVAPDGRLTLMDFGLARRVSSEDAPSDGLVAGTPRYMAPELARGQPASAASDVYALGVMAWELMTGRPPFPGDGREVLRAHVQQPVPELPASAGPPPLAAFARAALGKDPSRRPRNLRVIGEALTPSAPLTARAGERQITVRLAFDPTAETRVRELVADLERAAHGLARVHVDAPGPAPAADAAVPSTVVLER